MNKKSGIQLWGSRGAKKPKNQKVQFFSKKPVFFLVGGHLGDKFKCQKIKNIII